MAQLVIILLALGLVVAACNRDVQGTSRAFNELPPAVQKTARAQAPNVEIDSVAHKTKDGREIYEIRFLDGERKPMVVIAPDGTLISSDFPGPPGVFQKRLAPTGATGTPFSALPLNAQKAIQSHAPDSPIASIRRTEQDGRVVYEVRFTDQPSGSPLRIAEDGTLLQEAPPE